MIYVNFGFWSNLKLYVLCAQKFIRGKLDDILSGFSQEIRLSTTRSNVTTSGNTSVITEIDPRHRTSYRTSISDFTVSTAHARRSDVVTLGGVNKRKRASLPERLSISTRDASCTQAEHSEVRETCADWPTAAPPATNNSAVACD